MAFLAKPTRRLWKKPQRKWVLINSQNQLLTLRPSDYRFHFPFSNFVSHFRTRYLIQEKSSNCFEREKNYNLWKRLKLFTEMLKCVLHSTANYISSSWTLKPFLAFPATFPLFKQFSFFFHFTLTKKCFADFFYFIL